MKEKREDTVIIDIEETAKLKKENEELQSELKNVKLDLRIEKREVEKKSSLLTYVREKESKNREKIEEFALDPNNVFEAVVKYGSDGFSQNPTYRNSEIDQKTIYASYFVILMIKVKNTVSQKSNYFFVNQMSNSWTAISYLRLSYEEESYGKIIKIL